MQFTTLLFAAVAFVGSVSAQSVLNITNIDVSGLKVGVPFEVTWGTAKGPVTLTLQHGLDANNLEPYKVLTTNGAFPEGSLTFTPTADMPSDNYNFMVADGVSKPNYSEQFQFFGATAPTPTGSNTTVSSTSSSSSTTSETSSSATTRPSTSKTTSAGSQGTSGTTAALNKDGSASGLASPIAMVFLGLAAFMAFN